MAIISISINEKMLEEIDKAQKDLGFSGRSEAIRAGIRMLLEDAKEKDLLSGRVRGVLLLTHEHEVEDFVTKVKHNYLDIIYTQIHNRFKENRCLELFILDGEAERIRELTKEFQRNEAIDHVKLILT
ncbi:MAG: CopG family ribbon-helix-helix protein [Candidatus Bathyarchaeia archaeon]|nr:CopG family ribbon-helix-helix protein [Candidatus Bathyarchaeota archaeon]